MLTDVSFWFTKLDSLLFCVGSDYHFQTGVPYPSYYVRGFRPHKLSRCDAALQFSIFFNQNFGISTCVSFWAIKFDILLFCAAFVCHILTWSPLLLFPTMRQGSYSEAYMAVQFETNR